MTPPPVRCRFGPLGRFELDTVTQRLLRDGQPLKLPSRALELLQALIERRHRVVPKAELAEVLAARRAVDTAEATRLITVLRRLLGEGSIRTHPGRGWRFALPVLGEAAAPLHVKPRALPSAEPEAQPGLLPRTLLRPLLGREADQAVLGALLAERRLITIVGREGVGKTQCAAHALARRPGVVWVDLSHLLPASPALDADAAAVASVASTIAWAFGSRHPAAEPLPDLARALRLLDVPALWLVLDETTQSGLPRDAVAAVVQQLLEAAPPLRVLLLATQPLQLPGESVHRLQALPSPAPGADAATARQSTALRLLAAQARRAERHFQLELHTQGDCDAACALVAYLEGVPLALELAGARLPSLGVQRLLQELVHHRASLPADAGAARSSVLRQVMEWTLHRLTDDEAALLQTAARVADRQGLFSLFDLVGLDPVHGGISDSGADTLDALVDAAIVQLVPREPDDEDLFQLPCAWRHRLRGG